jgi:ABC-type branched-subunit amino acid transport system ATPase component
MSNLLEIKDLYGGYEQYVNILQGIDLTVAEGEAVGIIGLNGSGKSTLGKAVMNLIPYRKGSIVFNGQHIEDKSTHELARMGIALMHQGGVVFPNLSVWQNLQLALVNARRTEETQKYVSLQSVIPLLQKPRKELMRTMADKLSGGQRHELALAMTLARQPKLVILDEPSAGLSPKAVEEMYGMLGKIRENYGVTIMLIEQNVTRAVGFCERCVMMEAGTVVFKFDEFNKDKIESIVFNFN